MTNIVPIKGSHQAPKEWRSTMETLIISVEQINQWRIPPWQRAVRVTGKVQEIAEEMKRANSCTITGIITLGRVGKDQTLNVVDGQHRLEAFRLSGQDEVIADVRIIHFDSEAEMAEEFVRLNTALRRMNPDDILRGMEPSHSALRKVRRACPFVGYDNIRRNMANSPLVSMSLILRAWRNSSADIPAGNVGGCGIATIAAEFNDEDADELIRYMNVAHQAWGRDPGTSRLWGGLNMTLCMWMWRQLVMDKERRGNRRVVVLNETNFKQCLMSVGADPHYHDWLVGRVMGERDRSAAYTKLKATFARRLFSEGATKRVLLPQPAWSR